MFRHIVIFRWKPGTTEFQSAAALAALNDWGVVAEEFGSLSVAVDAGLAPGNGDAAVIVDFTDRERYVAYSQDPRHQQMISTYITPILADRLAVQCEI